MRIYNPYLPMAVCWLYVLFEAPVLMGNALLKASLYKFRNLSYAMLAEVKLKISIS